MRGLRVAEPEGMRKDRSGIVAAVLRGAVLVACVALGLVYGTLGQAWDDGNIKSYTLFEDPPMPLLFPCAPGALGKTAKASKGLRFFLYSRRHRTDWPYARLLLSAG